MSDIDRMLVVGVESKNDLPFGVRLNVKGSHLPDEFPNGQPFALSVGFLSTELKIMLGVLEDSTTLRRWFSSRDPGGDTIHIDTRLVGDSYAQYDGYLAVDDLPLDELVVTSGLVEPVFKEGEFHLPFVEKPYTQKLDIPQSIGSLSLYASR